MVIHSSNGYPEARLVEDCDIYLFYKTTEWFEQKIGIDFIKKTEYADVIAWEFRFSGATLLLHYSPARGIVLCPAALVQATQHDGAAFIKLIDAIQFD